MFRERIQLKTLDEIRLMRSAGHIVAGMLAEVRAAIAPGVTTAELDAIADAYLVSRGALSNFKGYHGYPATVCISVNEEIVHGIPGERVIGVGDVVSVDGGCSVAGTGGKRWHGDSAFTVVVDPAADDDAALSTVTEDGLWAAIAAVARGQRLGVVGDAIEQVVAEAAANGTTVAIVQEYVGHGIGTEMHQPPEVLNYSTRERGVRLKPGMVLAIEPMLTGGGAGNRTLEDRWTVVTRDGSRAAHWEHSVAILPGGVNVLTALDGGAAGLERFGLTPVPLEP